MSLSGEISPKDLGELLGSNIKTILKEHKLNYLPFWGLLAWQLSEDNFVGDQSRVGLLTDATKNMSNYSDYLWGMTAVDVATISTLKIPSVIRPPLVFPRMTDDQTIGSSAFNFFRRPGRIAIVRFNISDPNNSNLGV